MTERTTIRPESGHGLERVIFFSDAVIAIALTLLALELRAPAADPARGVTMLADFQEKLWHEYLSFVISFVVIAVFWFHHHRFFQQIAKLSNLLIYVNIGSLFAIVLVPFATKVLPELGDTPYGPVFYASVMVLWGVMYVLMAIIAKRQKLWRDDAPPTAPSNMIFGACVSLGSFALSIPIAFVNPSFAMYFWITAWPIARIGGLLRNRRRDRAGTAQPADDVEQAEPQPQPAR